MYKYLLTSLILIFGLQTYAFEDYIIMTDGKLSNIKIQDESIVEINPLVTITNEKNTLFVFPKKTGVTTFTLKKDLDKNYIFHIKVEEDKTIISDVEGFEIITIDVPQSGIELDTPPTKLGDFLDLPPQLRGKEVG